MMKSLLLLHGIPISLYPIPGVILETAIT